MKVEVFPTLAVLAGKAAEALARVLRRNRHPVLLLPAGKTAVPVYRELRRLHAAGHAPMARATTFNLDELRLPAADPRSFRSFMDRHLFSDVDLPPDRIRFPRPTLRPTRAGGDATHALRESVRPRAAVCA